MVDLNTIVNAEHAYAEHEHRELLLGIDHIHAVGLAVGAIARPDLADQLLSVLTWIEKVLVPHIRWEDEVVYREVELRAGTHWVTTVMRMEHSQLREMAADLRHDYEGLQHEAVAGRLGDTRARLFGFEAVLKAHLQREEALLLPLISE